MHSEEVDYGPLLKESEDEFWYGIGDQLLCIGYINGIPSGIPDSPESSTTYTFQFAANIPCPGLPVVNFEGQTYNTIQIFSQCWLKENLNAGSRIPGSSEMTDNQITEKWCHSDLDSNCNLYGGLYSWRESMDYAVSEGSRGLCPPGWHIPALEETRVLNGAADSQFGIGDTEWDKFGQRGFDAGYNLKSTWSWLYNFNGSDLFDFSALGASYRTGGGNFWILGDDTDFWTSSGNEQSQVYVMGLNFWNEMVYSFPTTIENNASAGFSVRCIRDN
jgi:uncharacterized protein (TIGR02145 family)